MNTVEILVNGERRFLSFNVTGWTLARYYDGEHIVKLKIKHDGEEVTQ